MKHAGDCPPRRAVQPGAAVTRSAESLAEPICGVGFERRSGGSPKVGPLPTAMGSWKGARDSRSPHPSRTPRQPQRSD